MNQDEFEEVLFSLWGIDAVDQTKNQAIFEAIDEEKKLGFLLNAIKSV